jgi:hypothetical protein
MSSRGVGDIIPIALWVDRCCPAPLRDLSDAFWQINERLPCGAAGVDNVVALVDAVAEVVLPEELSDALHRPDVLHRVEFR